MLAEEELRLRRSARTPTRGGADSRVRLGFAKKVQLLDLPRQTKRIRIYLAENMGIGESTLRKVEEDADNNREQAVKFPQDTSSRGGNT